MEDSGQGIQTVVSPKVPKQLKQFQEDLEKSNQHLIDCILSAQKLDEVVSKSSYKDFAKHQANVNANFAKEEKIRLQISILAQREQQLILKNQDLKDRAAAREAANQEKARKAEEKRTAAMNKVTETIISNSQAEVDAYNNSANGAAEVTETLNEQDKAIAAVANTMTDHVQVLNQDTAATSRSNISRQRAAFLLEEERQNIRRNNTDLRLQVREANAVQGSLEQRRAALIRLNAVYDNQSPQERASAAGQRLQRIIEGLTEQVSTLERATGRSQRNVGNYASALGTAWSGLRSIANILPGLGIAGLIAFATDPIIDYVKNLEIFKRSARDIAKDTGLGSSEYKSALTDVQKLKVAVEEFHSGIITGTDLLAVYNDGIGKTAGELKSAAEAEAFYNEKAADYVTAMSLRAQANAALETAIDNTVKAQQRQAGGNTFLDYLKSTGDALTGLLTLRFVNGKNPIDEFKDSLSAFKQADINELKKGATDATKLFEDLQKEADAFAKKKGLDLNGSPDGSGKNTDEFDLQKQRLTRSKAIAKATADNEKASLDERLEAARDYDQAVRDLAKLETSNSLIQDGVTAKRKLIINENLNNELLDADIAFAEMTDKIFNDQLTKDEKARVKANQKEISDIKETESTKLSQLKRAYANGTITKEQYEKLELDIQNEYDLKIIDAELRQAQALLDITTLTTDERADAEKKLRDVRIKYANEAADQSIKASEKTFKSEEEIERKRLELQSELRDRRMEFAQEIENFAIALVEGSYNREQERLSDQMEQADRKKDLDIQNVNDSVASEQEKEEKIAIIEARAFGNRLVLEERQKKLDEQRARFKKLASIAEIGIDTAKTIFQLNATGATLLANPLTAFLAPLAFGQIPFVLGVGAAQIGAIMAFEKGGVVPNDGPIITGEKGVELRINPDGSTEFTPSFANISYADAGTKIIPHHELVRMMAKPEPLVSVNGTQVDLTPMIMEQRKSSDKIYKAIKAQKQARPMSKRALYEANNQTIQLMEWRKRNI